MKDPLAECGQAEPFKAGVHLVIFSFASMCLGYNAMAACQRDDRHLKVNVAVYAALLVFEAEQIYLHMRNRA